MHSLMYDEHEATDSWPNLSQTLGNSRHINLPPHIKQNYLYMFDFQEVRLCHFLSYRSPGFLKVFQSFFLILPAFSPIFSPVLAPDHLQSKKRHLTQKKNLVSNLVEENSILWHFVTSSLFHKHTVC